MATGEWRAAHAAEIQGSAKVAIIGQTVATQPFGDADRLGDG